MQLSCLSEYATLTLNKCKSLILFFVLLFFLFCFFSFLFLSFFLSVRCRLIPIKVRPKAKLWTRELGWKRKKWIKKEKNGLKKNTATTMTRLRILYPLQSRSTPTHNYGHTEMFWKIENSTYKIILPGKNVNWRLF